MMGGKSHHSHRSNISRDMRLMHPEQVHDVVLRLTQLSMFVDRDTFHEYKKKLSRPLEEQGKEPLLKMNPTLAECNGDSVFLPQK